MGTYVSIGGGVAVTLANLSTPGQARGDLIVYGPSAWVRSPIGVTPGHVWTTDGTDGGWAPAAGGLTNWTEAAGATYASIGPATAGYDTVILYGFNSLQTDVGGNARGTSAVDLQNNRLSANQVASGNYALLGGGRRNRNDADYGAGLGGQTNDLTGNNSGYVSGTDWLISGQYCFGGGGMGGSLTANFGAGIGGEFGESSATGAVFLGGVSALADMPCSFAFGGNSVAASAAQQGKSQGQGIHLDGRSSLATPVNLTADGTELKVPTNGILRLRLQAVVYNETADTGLDFVEHDILAINVAGTCTLIAGAGSFVVGNTNNVGAPTLVASASGGNVRLVFTPTADLMRCSVVDVMPRAAKT